MKIVVFLSRLSLGGTERAAALWANGLRRRGHQVELLAMEDGPGRERFATDVPCHVAHESDAIAGALRQIRPDAIHTHQYGWPGAYDVLGVALQTLDFRIPVVQTNVFGQLLNPAEDAWTTVRAFVSWTSCVQAAGRRGLPLDRRFFRRATVVSNPLAPQEPASPEAVAAFRKSLGVADDEVLCGKIGRPDLLKWSTLAMDGFAVARRTHPKLKFLIRELPPEVSATYRTWLDEGVLISLPMTGDEAALRLTISSMDLLLHTSKIGESFGYGIAEGMILGKPIITNPTPRDDQAQVELVEHNGCGLLASSPRSVGRAILRLATDPALRQRFGASGRERIRRIADAEASTDRLETLLAAVAAGGENPFVEQDLRTAQQASTHLRTHRFGHDWRDVIRLGATTGFFGLLKQGRAALRKVGVLPGA